MVVLIRHQNRIGVPVSFTGYGVPREGGEKLFGLLACFFQSGALAPFRVQLVFAVVNVEEVACHHRLAA